MPNIAMYIIKLTDALRLVLLGVHTAMKDDLQYTTAELIKILWYNFILAKFLLVASY